MIKQFNMLAMNSNTMLYEADAVEDVEKVITETFGRGAPPPEEILRHKWIESEKAGYDIGLDAALQDWQVKHHLQWRLAREGRRLDVLVFHVLVPLACLRGILAVVVFAGWDPVDAFLRYYYKF
jgi:hypothetical protein